MNVRLFYFNCIDKNRKLIGFYLCFLIFIMNSTLFLQYFA